MKVIFFNDNTMNPLMVNVRFMLLLLLRVRLLLCEIDREGKQKFQVDHTNPQVIK